MTIRIGYGKLGRSMTMDPARYGPQGDAEAPQLLQRLARRNPEVEFVIIGKHGKYDPASMPSNVIDPWPADIKYLYVYKGGKYVCNFCGTEAAYGVLECCEWGRYARDVEKYVIGLSSQLDGIVMHLGQHGPCNTGIPRVKTMWADNDFANPQVSLRNLGGTIIEELNAFSNANDGKGPITYLCADPRNYIKARDLKWPTGFDDALAQYNWTRTSLHDRYLDTRTPAELGFKDIKVERKGELWRAKNTYRLAGLEMMILPDDWETWGAAGFDERLPVGVATTAAWTENPAVCRAILVREYIFKNYPQAEVFGRWDDASTAALEGTGAIGKNTVEQFPLLLQRWRVTAALPPMAMHIDGFHWTTAKPYQCFAGNIACLFIGSHDALGWTIPNTVRVKGSEDIGDGLFSVRNDWTADERALAKWLRTTSPADFKIKADAISTSRETWEWIVSTQRTLLKRRWDEALLENTIERKLGLA